MILKRLHDKIRASVKLLQRYADRFWYAPLIGFLAALDNLIVVVPTDGILISSSMLIPRRWFVYALSIAIGSTVGAIALAALVEFHGLPWVLDLYPGINETRSWALSMGFFDKYGLLLVFAVAITPFVQQPAIILASLANTPLLKLALVVFTGRLIKFVVIAYLGSHTPRLLKKLWGLKGELQDAGVTLNEQEDVGSSRSAGQF